MARIRNRKGRYTAEVRKPGFKAVAKTFGTKKAAVQWSREIERAMDRCDYRMIEPHSLKEAIEAVIDLDTLDRDADAEREDAAVLAESSQRVKLALRGIV